MVKIERHTTKPNGIGGWIEEWAPHIDNYTHSAFDMLSGDEVLKAEKLGIQSSHILVSTHITDVKQGDRVLFKEDYYRVKFVDNPMNLDKHLEIYLEYVGEWSE